jgi:hypothetical protein
MCRTLAFFALIAGIASAWGAEEPATIDDALKAKAVAMLGGYKPPRPIARTLQDEEIDTKGVIGKKLIRGRSLYIPQEAGLVRMENANSLGGSVEAVLVCGLITLESSAFAPGDPLSVQSGFRAIALETTSLALCRPIPGAQFSYRIQAERRFRTSSAYLPDRARNVAETYDVACKAGEAFIPARRILESLEGNALMVRCERKSQKGIVMVVEYAFLEDSRFYLRLGEQHPGQSLKIRYTEILFRK